MKIQIGEVGELNPFLKAFMDELEVAQSNIFPETTAARDASALLMSRPIAMVRTTVGLEVMGNFKFDQSWNALASALNRNGKITTAEYEKVKFPIILGEHKQLSDGLVGYWLNEGNRIKDIFYSNTDGEDSKGIEHHHQLKKSLEDEPSILTVLMDPRSILHATTGILPVKTIQIPSEHYSEELRRIEIDFQVAPIITPSKEINISMPKQKEKLWEWYEKDESGGLNRSVPTHFNDNGSFYKQKIREGWMKLKKEKE